MSHPLVTIIIPTYNRAAIIGKTLDSILAQTYKNWECIVVDDGSTDTTALVMKKYCDTDPRFRYVSRPDTHKPGGNGARNYGLKLAKGAYVQWFDSDDLMHPNKLQAQLDLLLADQEAGVCICSGQKVEKETSRPLRKNFEEDFFTQIALNSSEIMTPSLLLKRSFLVKHSLGFDEELYRGQETDFLLRLSQVVHRKELIFTEEELFYYIFTTDSKSKKDEVYDSRFKWSRAKIYLDIVTMSKERGYTHLVAKSMKRVIRIYFSALKHKDDATGSYILKRLQHVLGKEFPVFCRQLKWVAMLQKFIPLPTLKLRKHFQKKVSSLLSDFAFKE